MRERGGGEGERARQTVEKANADNRRLPNRHFTCVCPVCVLRVCAMWVCVCAPYVCVNTFNNILVVASMGHAACPLACIR